MRENLELLLEFVEARDQFAASANFDYRFFIEAQKKILRKIRPFLSRKVLQGIRERVKMGDLRLFQLFSRFNEGSLNIQEFLAGVYKTFSGLDEFLTFCVPTDTRECFEEGKSDLEEDCLKLATGILRAGGNGEDVIRLFAETESEMTTVRNCRDKILKR